MTDQNDPIETRTVWAEPYTARQCPECETWVYVADGPFAEGDPTKTLADTLHWERLHLEKSPATSFGRPYFYFNETPVEATLEIATTEQASTDAPSPGGIGTVMDRLDHLQHRPNPEPPGIGD